MNVTVYFGTNRLVTDATDADGGFPATMVPPLDAGAMSYGTAFVTGVDVATGAQGTVAAMGPVTQGGFSDEAIDDLVSSGRNLLVFVHGFDNSFSDAVTRAAYNAAWMSASGVPEADMSVIAFAWPSIGQVVGWPFPTSDYRTDQRMAALSGAHLMAFLAGLAPVIADARARDPELLVVLLAHSMGNLALQSAVEHWFMAGHAPQVVFDRAILAAGDCRYDSFDDGIPVQLSGLPQLARRCDIYYSHDDHVLQLSMAVNLGAQRLGQDGPEGRADAARFPAASYAMIDCSAYRDYDFGLLASHQYYRLSPGVRTLIANSL